MTMRPTDMKQTSRNILWSMDEAGRIGIPNLPEHASTVVGRKISLSMSAQSRSQFTAIYGRARTENLFTNIRTQLVFCSGRPGDRQALLGADGGHLRLRPLGKRAWGRDNQHGQIRAGHPRDESAGFYGNG